MKEAVVKLTGRGITGKEQLRPLLDDYYKGKSPWQIITKDFPEKKYVVSICYEAISEWKVKNEEGLARRPKGKPIQVTFYHEKGYERP